MAGLLVSREDLCFQLYDWLQAEALLSAPRFAAHSRETFDAVIDSCERLGEDVLLPCHALSDRQEPGFDGERVHLPGEVAAAVRAVADSGVIAATRDEAVGGMQLPVLVEKAALAYLCAANIGACAYPLLTAGNASLLLAHASPAQVEAFALPQLRGEWAGTMCLSEPQAGSSLSDITTRADYECESPLGPQYRLAGRKMWISGGEHEILGNIVHLVLAKVPDADDRLPPGTRGISLFIVPRTLPDGHGAERNDVSLAGLNHKLGYRAAVNCALNFGEGRHRPQGRAGAIGWLVGRPGEGLAGMFHMMNEARIGVGLGAVALGYTAYLHSLDYARNRPQGRLPGPVGKDPAQPQVALVAHADVRRMLLAQKSYAEGGLGLVLACANLVDDARIARAQCRSVGIGCFGGFDTALLQCLDGGRHMLLEGEIRQPPVDACQRLFGRRESRVRAEQLAVVRAGRIQVAGSLDARARGKLRQQFLLANGGGEPLAGADMVVLQGQRAAEGGAGFGGTERGQGLFAGAHFVGQRRCRGRILAIGNGLRAGGGCRRGGFGGCRRFADQRIGHAGHGRRLVDVIEARFDARLRQPQQQADTGHAGREQSPPPHLPAARTP